MEILVAFGYVFSLAVYGLPMITMREVKRTQSVGERSAVPYVAALLTCGMWVLYGLTTPRRQALIIRNAMGTPFHAIYIGVFVYYYSRLHRILSLVYILPGFAGFVALLGLFLAGALDPAVLGYMCAVAGCATPLLPFLNMRTVWQRKSMDTMPPALLAAASFINGAIWTSSTFLAKPRDWATVIPNGVAALSASIILLLHLVFWLTRPADILAGGDIKMPLLQGTEPTATPTGTPEGGVRGQDDDDDNVAGGADNIS